MSAAEEKVDIAPEAVVSSEEKKTVEPTTEATTTEETKGETPTVAPTVSNFGDPFQLLRFILAAC